MKAWRILIVIPLVYTCGGAPVDRPEVVWPYPPDKPRVKFVRAFARETDLAPSGWQSFMRAITGTESGLNVMQPMGLALSIDEQKLFVACPHNKLVLRFDFEEKTLRQHASDPGYEPWMPFGLAVDNNDELFVTDSKRKQVLVYSADNRFLRQLSHETIERPTGIAIDRERELVYVVDTATKDSNHHTIEVFTTAGEHLRSIGGKGSEDGKFYFPSYIAVDHDGQLYVGDVMNFRVQVFDPDGRFVSKFGEEGHGYGKFGRLKGLAVDAFNNLHVADGWFGLVQIFNPKLQPLMYYGGRANKLEFFDMPTAVVVDSKNQIYVANFGVSRVNQYTLMNTAAEDSFDAPPPPPPDEGGPPDGSPARVEDFGG